jgi:hypothetical protein
MRKKPPALATWILEHLQTGEKNHALEGDLAEEFGNGRGSIWYWRQVLAAVAMGLAGTVREHWLAMVFAALWTAPVPTLDIFVLRKIEMTPFFAQRWGLAWPLSTICDLGLTIAWAIFYIWLGLALSFLALWPERSMPLRRLKRSFLVSGTVFVALFATLMVLWLAFSPFHSDGIDIRRLTPLSAMTVPAFLLTRVPNWMALVAGMLAGVQNESRGAVRVRKA